MAEERNALMEMAYPEIQTFCQQHGLTFEVKMLLKKKFCCE